MSPKPLFKTTIIIWSDRDPDIEYGSAAGGNVLSDLAREAEVGDAYCSKMSAKRVGNPQKDPDWNGTEFFDDPKESAFAQENDPNKEETPENVTVCCFEEEDGIVVVLKENVEKSKETKVVSEKAKLLYEITAATWEEAMAIHHLRQGFEPYKPGEPGQCPACGAVVYRGSGKCWSCHEVS